VFAALKILKGRSILEAALAFVAGALAEQWTFTEAADAFLQAKEDQRSSPEYLRSLRSSLNVARETFGSRVLDEISPGDLEAWLRGRKLSPVTWRNYRRDLGMVFRFAQARERCARNPAKLVMRPRDADRPVIILKTPDAMSLLRAADCRLIRFLCLGLFGGLRPFEALKANVRLERRQIEVAGRHSKSRRRRFVTVCDNLSEWLEAYPAPETSSYWTHRDWLDQARDKAGVTLCQDIFRHSFASHHLALHQNAALTAHELGHSNQEILFRHYRELVTKEEAATYFEITPRNTFS
jgi:integrase/recombinase XerD